jgi:hypothetical protein
MKKLLFGLLSLLFVHTSLYGVSVGTVTGTVTDNLGNLLDGVTITIYKNQHVHETAITVNGHYSITTTPDKKYVITASLAHYQSQSQGLIIEKTKPQ